MNAYHVPGTVLVTLDVFPAPPHLVLTITLLDIFLIPILPEETKAYIEFK